MPLGQSVCLSIQAHQSFLVIVDPSRYLTGHNQPGRGSYSLLRQRRPAEHVSFLFYRASYLNTASVK